MKFLKPKRLFFDYASATPLDRAVLWRMLPFLVSRFANAGAIYREGVLEKRALESARRRLATVLGIQQAEVFFTGSGTESNNIAIMGIVNAYRAKNPGNIPHVITTTIEHSSVLRVCQALEKKGVAVTYISPNEKGTIEVKKIEDAITPQTILVSVQAVNNEIGTILPVAQIGRMIRARRKKHDSVHPYFHSDASQATNTLSVRVDTLNVDVLTLDAGKCYGPKGVGILAVRRAVEITPIFYGGGQEVGLRPATENLAGIVGATEAICRAQENYKKENARLAEIQNYFETEIGKQFPQAEIAGKKADRSPHVCNICFRGIDSEFTVLKLDHKGIAVSAASTCMNTAEESFSYVVKAIAPGCESSSLRFSFGKQTRKRHVKKLLAILKTVLQ